MLPSKPFNECSALEVFRVLQGPSLEGWCVAAFCEPPALVSGDLDPLDACAAKLLTELGPQLWGRPDAYLEGQVLTEGRWHRVYVAPLWLSETKNS